MPMYLSHLILSYPILSYLIYLFPHHTPVFFYLTMGGLATSQGSATSILYSRSKLYGLTPSKEIAGLMLSGADGGWAGWGGWELLKMAIEIVDFPIKNGGSFHSYLNVYQRVSGCCRNSWPHGHISSQCSPATRHHPARGWNVWNRIRSTEAPHTPKS